MNHLSQRDPQWGAMTIGASQTKCQDAGCFLTCLSMLSYMNPFEANQRILTAGGFGGPSGDDIIEEIACKALGLTFNGSKLIGSIPNPTSVCIAEVVAAHSIKHFVIYLGFNEQIIDPWDGQVKTNPYPVKSWRLIGEHKPTKDAVIQQMTLLINSI